MPDIVDTYLGWMLNIWEAYGWKLIIAMVAIGGYFILKK